MKSWKKSRRERKRRRKNSWGCSYQVRKSRAAKELRARAREAHKVELWGDMVRESIRDWFWKPFYKMFPSTRKQQLRQEKKAKPASQQQNDNANMPPRQVPVAGHRG